jgi:hypothetical protein
MMRFEQEQMGRGPKDIHAHLIGDLLVVRLQGVLTAAEQHLDCRAHVEVERSAVIDEITKAGIWPNPIVTEVTPAPTFYMAEDYHQEYYKTNPEQPYCQAVIAPKVSKFRKQYFEKLKK